MVSGKFAGLMVRIGLVLTSVATAGCTVRPLPHVEVAVPARGLAGPFTIAAPENPDGRRLAASLAAALAGRGLKQTDATPATMIDIALVRRAASLGVANEEANSGAGDDVIWLSPPRPKRAFDGCEPQRLEASVLARVPDSATVIFKGRGGFDACKIAPRDIDALASLFAEALLAR